MRYIRVVDGEIIKPDRPLPTNWENISNFYLLDNEALKTFGWFPYRYIHAEIPPGFKPNGSHLVLEEDEVIEYQDIREITELEIQIDIENEWKNIRSTRNSIILESDWTQLLDSPLTIEQKEEWKIYRQALRDITLQPDPFNITWPIKPGTENE